MPNEKGSNEKGQEKKSTQEASEAWERFLSFGSAIMQTPPKRDKNKTERTGKPARKKREGTDDEGKD